jgi:hypothetical protein
MKKKIKEFAITILCASIFIAVIFAFQMKKHNDLMKQLEWYGQRYANFCYEHEVLTPTHHDWEQFMEEDPAYYNTHVEQAQATIDLKTSK